MKKYLPLIAVMLLAACSPAENTSSESLTGQDAVQDSSETGSSEESAGNEAETPHEDESKLTKIFNEILDNTSHGDFIQVSENNILNRYGIDTADLEDYIFEEPATADNADTIIIVKCNSEDTAADVEQVLNTQLENSKATTENYAPDQFALYDKSILKRDGVWVYWIVNDTPDKAEEIIKNSMD